MTVWDALISEVRNELNPRRDMVVDKSAVTHPENLDLEQSLAAPNGQSADYRISLEDGTSIHIKEYEDIYKIHWDEKDPNRDPIGHLAADAPQWGFALGAFGIWALSQLSGPED